MQMKCIGHILTLHRCRCFFAILFALQIVACESLIHPSLDQFSQYQMKPSQDSREGLNAQFFGVTTIQIDDGKTAIMIDGFFSRPGLLQLLFGDLEPDQARIKTALQKSSFTKLAAVLVSHSHYDHAMDAAVVAAQKKAKLIGSQSTANIGHGFRKEGKEVLPPEDIRVPIHDEILRFGDFSVQFFESPHSPDPPYRGIITGPLQTPAPVSSYLEGGNYSFLLRHERGNILVHPSANYKQYLFRDVKADIVFLSIGLLGKQSESFATQYWEEVVHKTGAKLVIPIHWDDLSRSLDKPLLPMPYLFDNFNVAMERLIKLAAKDGVKLRLMPLFQAIALPQTGEKLCDCSR